ncbi:Uncharacterized membrane protein ycf78 (chloroplast) [Coccomyxa sp. Obi]|nr:Uncharacterized membrane protein ycf78 [Coccomyxa sp. Obi]
MSSLILPTLGYILASLKYGIVYLLSFQWLRDLVYLPLLVPQLTVSFLKEHSYPLDNPALNFFAFLEEPAYKHSKLFLGFLNSFFACLPISAAHILSARRLLVQGIPAGVAAGSGIVVGQCWFVACVIFGLRGFLIPWFSLEPVSYIVGLGLLIHVVYKITHERRIRVIKWADRGELAQYFVLSFLLTWCEQSSIFQYLGNLTVGPEPTALDTFSSSNGGGSFLIDGSYVLGFLLGSCMFTVIFGCLSLLLRKLWLQSWSTTASRLTNQLNSLFLVLLIAFSFASVPYYGIDYLLTNELGFLPQDKSLNRTIVYPSTTGDISQILGRMSDSKSFDTDVSTFDRGVYLQEDKPLPQSFEDLNYQGEYAWTKRASKFVKHLTRTNTPSAWYKLLGNDGQGSAEDKPSSSSKADAPDQVSRGFGVSSKGNGQSQLRDRSEDLKGKPLGVEARRELGGGESGMISDLVALENDIVAKLGNAPLGQNGAEDDISYMAETVSEDGETEKQFLSLFDTGLSPLFIADMPEPSAIEKNLKKKYAENPLYSLLLRIDIDSFLTRQPASHLLSPLEERTLFQKRQILGHYYDTLRQYNQLQNWDEFQTIYNGSKSFANRVYNQQFKGTLKVVRRLFSITLDRDRDQGEGDRRILKFDQPLFQQERGGSLATPGHASHASHASHAPPLGGARDARDARGGQGQALNLHEELFPFARRNSERSPFLEGVNPRPLYAGWDEELRKLVLTNRAMPRSEAMYQTDAQVNQGLGEDAYGRFSNMFASGVSFTAWPIPEQLLTKPKSQSDVPYHVAFATSGGPQKQGLAEALQSFSEIQDQGAVGGSTWDMSRWPANLRLIDERSGAMSWTRGGFVWPGHSQLKVFGERSGNKASQVRGGEPPQGVPSDGT